MSGEKKIEKTLSPPAVPDVDISTYKRTARAVKPRPVDKLPEDVLKRAAEVGIIADESSRSGTYFQIDHSIVFKGVAKSFEGKAEIMSTRDALKKYGWVRDYWWKLISPAADKFTALAEKEWDQGYFIHILPGQQVTLPLQACLFYSQENLDQNVHNLIIAEPNSKAQIITGCAVHPNVRRALHVGISEFYLKENAELTFTMIHNWSDQVEVRPRTAAVLADGATFSSNYITMAPVRSLQMYPVTHCRGDDSRARFTTILYGGGDSKLDVGSKIILTGKGTRGEVISRTIATNSSEISARGLLVGEHPESKAHLECNGLLLSDKARIHAIPELIGKSRGTELSHEAAIEKISEEEVEYLMARGFSREEATSLIVRGFMDVGILGLPKILEDEMKRLVETTTSQAM